MPEILTREIMTAVTTNGTKTAFDIRNTTAWAVHVRAVGGTSAAVQFEGTADPLGVSGFALLGMRQAGGGAYATTAVSVAPAAAVSLYFAPEDNVSWVRAVVSAQTGPTALTATFSGEL